LVARKIGRGQGHNGREEEGGKGEGGKEKKKKERMSGWWDEYWHNVMKEGKAATPALSKTFREDQNPLPEGFHSE